MPRVLGTKIRAFNEIDNQSLINHFKNELKGEISSKQKSYISGVDEQEFKSFLIDKYTLEVLHIDIIVKSLVSLCLKRKLDRTGMAILK
jgi:hypothetical protein